MLFESNVIREDLVSEAGFTDWGMSINLAKLDESLVIHAELTYEGMAHD